MKLSLMREKRGLTLIEVCVSLAILAIVALILVQGFFTVGSVAVKTEEVKQDDAQLATEIIQESTSVEQETTIELASGSGGAVAYSIPITVQTYTADNGNEIKVFLDASS
ncbi:hypothetical protein FACS1894104_4150 [Actinomycetota bacterium]|nr:hypothetical protein FACS1894104_4150 [Actinomycetota bacterium]